MKLLFITSCVLLWLLIPILTLAAPGIPHQFYGTVSFTNGDTPDGLLVEAKIDNISVGSTITGEGRYGDSVFYVTDPDSDRNGKTIKFYVSGIDSGETETFVNGESTNLNLTISGSIGTIEETDENATIENETIAIAPDQSTNVKLGEDLLNITISSTVSTNAEITKIEKLESDFFTGATAIIAGNNLLNAFEIDITGDDLNISVTITYDDTDIDEDTIRPYYHNGSSWVEIADFDINKTTNTITFNISSAQTPYAIFGEESEPEPTPPADDGGGGGGSGGTTTPPTYKTGDTNKDGKVDKYDFALMMAAWGKTGINFSDLSGDNKVDKYDFALLMLNWSII